MVLDLACGENTLLRKAVEELLREDEAASGFLSEPLFSSIKGELRGQPHRSWSARRALCHRCTDWARRDG